ncbi:MAG: c-type cytochrome biogenesis protein CcmI [Burkholderiales bacterium]
MTIFVVICIALSILAVFLLVLPLFTLRPESRMASNATNVLIYRDQFKELDADLRIGTLTEEQFEKARSELEVRMLEDTDNVSTPAALPHNGRYAAYMLMIGLPVCAVALYAIVGTPGAFLTQPVTESASPHGTDAMQMEAIVSRLAARLKEDPTNGEGWMMLGRSNGSLGRFGEAAAAYKNAVAHSAPDAQLLADYADALAMAQGRQLSGEPEKLIARALEIDGKNKKALALAGTAAFERRDYAGAVGYWSRMRDLVPSGSDDEVRAIDANIAEARALGGQGSARVQPPEMAKQEMKAASQSASVSGIVTLATELAVKVSPTDTVFIFARAASGPPMPLAVLRKQVRDLPLAFKLDDSLAMTPAMKLSDFPKVVLGARISKSANATPQPGDFQGVTDAVRNDAKNLMVVINTEVR